MKKILTVLAVLFTHALAGEEAIRDPFAEGVEEPAGWPKRLAPSEKHLKRFDEPVLKGITPVDAGDIRFIWVPTFNKPTSNPVVGDEQEVKRIKETTNLDFRPFLAVCLKLFELSGLDERPAY